MKLQNKIFLVIFTFGVLVLVPLLVFNNLRSQDIAMKKEVQSLNDIAVDIASHMDSQFKENTKVAQTISSAPIVEEALNKSNEKYALLSNEKRKLQIQDLNTKWEKTSLPSDLFIQKHLTNPVAKFLKKQQKLIPGMYGEIFLTNRYGVMIASTGQLSTLSHAHKYWFKASFNDGEGRVFFDDRGFDTSASGYVLGIVIPIKEEDKIIGILKCNVNISGPLTSVVEEYSDNDHGLLQIVRTNGLILAQKGVEPLSQKISEKLIATLKKKDSGHILQEEKIISYSPIEITKGSINYGFGGSYESMDHIQGNTGEAWHIIISYGIDKALKIADETTRMLFLVAGLFFFIILAVAMYVGKWIARPIEHLSDVATKIGYGNFESRTELDSKDEVGLLAKSLNSMAENIENINKNRDELLEEIEEKNQYLISSNERLKELDRLKTLFIASMSHELRTPLNAIIGFSTILEKGMLGDLSEPQYDKVKRIHDAGEHLLGLIVDVLDVSKIEAGIVEIDIETFKLKELLSEALLDLEKTTKIKNISLNLDIDDDIEMQTDYNRLKQTLENYLLNAVKYSISGSITLHAELDKSNVRIEVIDTGIGISDESIAILFNAFERIDSPLSIEAGGTGMGLYLSKKIVQDILQGDVYVKSKVGEGSTFGIEIPQSINIATKSEGENDV